MTAPALLSSVRTDWRTPPEILELVRQLGPIALDPCGHQESLVGAAREYRRCRGEDGLALSWISDGVTYCNPPYGRVIGDWTFMASEEAWRGAEIVMLIPARTDTEWWHRDICGDVHADAICFWKGRITFVGGQYPAPFPSALIYWGKQVDKFRAVFSPHGQVIVRRRSRS